MKSFFKFWKNFFIVLAGFLAAFFTIYDFFRFRFKPHLSMETNLFVSVYSSLFIVLIISFLLLRNESNEKKLMQKLAKGLGGEISGEQDLKIDFISLHGKTDEGFFECQLTSDTESPYAPPSFFVKMVFQNSFPGYLIIRRVQASYDNAYDNAASKEIEFYESKIFAKNSEKGLAVSSTACEVSSSEFLSFDSTLSVEKKGDFAESLLKSEKKMGVLQEIFSDLSPEGWTDYLFKPVDWLFLYENSAVIHFRFFSGEYIRWNDVRVDRFQRLLKLLSELIKT